jgi:diguanylate cyclase (GGDEF)-like protein
MLVTARSADTAMRRPRRLFAAAMIAPALGTLIGVGYVLAQGSIPVPSLADPVSVAWFPFAVVGFWLIPTARGGSSGSLRVAADAFLATTALLFCTWLVVLGWVASHLRGGALAVVAQFAHPLVDVFVSALVLSLLPRVRADLRGMCNCAALGLLLVALGDLGTTVLTAQRGIIAFGWPDVPLQIGLSLLAASAFVRANPVLREQRESVRDRNMPLGFIVLATGVIVWHVSAGLRVSAVECVLGAAMMGAFVCRQMLGTRELVELAEAYRRSASADGLTGLPSRQAFLRRLREHLATPGCDPVVVMIFDLDGFKEVNDTFGHDIGDDVLRDFAATAKALVGDHLLARMGADEFVVLVAGEGPEQLAGDIGARLAGVHRMLSEHGAVDVRCSTGIAAAQQGDDPADLLRRADLALGAAKRARFALVTYTDDLGAAAERHHLLIAGLGGAAARGELSLSYQPVHSVSDGALVAAEALVRWHHPQLGQVPPDEFIPLAEGSGHIQQIGDWVLQTALNQLANWDEQGRHLPRLFVNASAEQFTPELPERVRQSLGDRGLDPSRLVLEITESQIPGLAANDAIAELRRDGVQIALDDFGSGYSSFAQLVRLPVDILKLDRDLITNVSQQAGEAVMRAVVELARSLQLSTVAEGIEDAQQLQAARLAGVEMAQGYLLNRPMQADQLGDILPERPAVPRPRPVPVGKVVA